MPPSPPSNGEGTRGRSECHLGSPSMSEGTTAPRASDVLSVRSRVSWGAIAAGAMVSLAIYFLLTLLGTALGLELLVRGRTDFDVAGRGHVSLETGAAIFAIFTLLLAMFFGG